MKIPQHTLTHPLTKSAILILCSVLMTGCFWNKSKVVSIGDAENLMFTDNNRFLVTGGQGIYEITKNNNTYQSTPLFQEGYCNFTGMAQYGDWVFAACTRNLVKTLLLAAPIDGNKPIHFHEISSLNGFLVANGLAFLESGDLLIANDNPVDFLIPITLGTSKLSINHELLPAASVASGYASGELTLDSNLLLGDLEHGWLSGNPNGIRVKDNKIFTTESGSVFRYELNGSQQVIEKKLLTHRNAVLDDLYPLCGGAIVTDFFGGEIFYVDANGYENPDYSTKGLSFIGPSAVTIPKGDMFNSNQLLMTEKGILMDNFSPIGNKVWAMNLSFNLQALQAYCD